MAVSQHFIAWSCGRKNLLDNWFLYAWMQAQKPFFERMAVGSTIKTIGLPIFKRISIDVPPLGEQRKIATILRTWDQAIERLEALRNANIRRRVWVRSHVFTGRTRLPGFSGEWRDVVLGQVLNEHGLQGTGAEEVFSVSVHKGLINQIEHLGRSFAAADTDHYNRVLPGDIVYTKSPTGDFPLGIIKRSKITQEVIVSPLYGVFTPASRALGVILDALFESPIAVRNYLSPLVQKGAKNTIAITNRRFLEGKLRLPMDPKEQVAIADVIETLQAELAAIDAEIRLVTRQKRGLMQKLLTGEWRVKVGGDHA
jgi:type I restriction enzyme S subunit